jgi:hypothetical protein
MTEPSSPDEALEPRYEHYSARYPSGVVLQCHYPGGVTLEEARVGHLYAVVEAGTHTRQRNMKKPGTPNLCTLLT